MPPGKHQDENIAVLYSFVDLGQAKKFVNYDIDDETLSIDQGATTETSIGTYTIKLQLIDQTGIYSNILILTLNIIQEEEFIETES